MSRQKVMTSLVVRVVTTDDRVRILLHDLSGRTVREFRSWEEALAHMRELSQRSGLR